MKQTRRGTIIAIGGREDREGDMHILRELGARVDGRTLIVSGVASGSPDEALSAYHDIWEEVGIKKVIELPVRTRVDALEVDVRKTFQDAGGVFFTGGDQLRITSQFGGTPIADEIQRFYERGGVVAGTSAGASVLCATMLVSGTNQESHKIGELQMGPGLGLVPWAIIDQHFAERGRMGRLIGAVAENPGILGIGIDEDTAIIAESDEEFYVRGDGAVYVLDGCSISYSNVAEETPQSTLSLHNIRMHVLADGDGFNILNRTPLKGN